MLIFSVFRDLQVCIYVSISVCLLKEFICDPTLIFVLFLICIYSDKILFYRPAYPPLNVEEIQRLLSEARYGIRNVLHDSIVFYSSDVFFRDTKKGHLARSAVRRYYH